MVWVWILWGKQWKAFPFPLQFISLFLEASNIFLSLPTRCLSPFTPSFLTIIFRTIYNEFRSCRVCSVYDLGLMPGRDNSCWEGNNCARDIPKILNPPSSLPPPPPLFIAHDHYHHRRTLVESPTLPKRILMELKLGTTQSQSHSAASRLSRNIII